MNSTSAASDSGSGGGAGFAAAAAGLAAPGFAGTAADFATAGFAAGGVAGFSATGADGFVSAVSAGFDAGGVDAFSGALPPARWLEQREGSAQDPWPGPARVDPNRPEVRFALAPLARRLSRHFFPALLIPRHLPRKGSRFRAAASTGSCGTGATEATDFARATGVLSSPFVEAITAEPAASALAGLGRARLHPASSAERV